MLRLLLSAALCGACRSNTPSEIVPDLPEPPPPDGATSGPAPPRSRYSWLTASETTKPAGTKVSTASIVITSKRGK